MNGFSVQVLFHILISAVTLTLYRKESISSREQGHIQDFPPHLAPPLFPPTATPPGPPALSGGPLAGCAKQVPTPFFSAQWLSTRLCHQAEEKETGVHSVRPGWSREHWPHPPWPGSTILGSTAMAYKEEAGAPSTCLATRQVHRVSNGLLLQPQWWSLALCHQAKEK